MKQYIIRIWLAIRIYVIIALSITIGVTAVFDCYEYKRLTRESKIIVINDFKEDSVAVKASAEVSPNEGEGEKSNLLPSWKIEKKIRQKFPEDPDTAIAIAKAESGLKIEAINVNTNGTKDRGLFQINSCHGYGDELFDIDFNLYVARQLYEKSGWNPWVVYQRGLTIK